MVLYAEYVKEPGGILSSFVLYPCTIPCRTVFGGVGGGECRSGGQPLATINKRK